jgi:hypothetical protein
MTRWTLTNTIIGPAAEILLQVSGARMARDIDRAGYNFNASSLTEQAYQWAHTLNHLTHRNNLQLCTLLPLKNLVSGFVLLSEKQRFCPAGYADDAVAGRGFYDRLLWSIDAVKACPLHRLQLVNRSEAKRRSVSDWGAWLPRKRRRRRAELRRRPLTGLHQTTRLTALALSRSFSTTRLFFLMQVTRPPLRPRFSLMPSTSSPKVRLLTSPHISM